MLPTPSTSHVNYDRVYEPAEDSFLLMDTLTSPSETLFLQRRFPASSPVPLALEVGSGSGVLLAFVTANSRHIFSRSDIVTLGVDINPFASSATSETVCKAIAPTSSSGLESALFGGAIVGDLASAMRPNSVDVLVFNPPYVPSEAVPSGPTPDNLHADTALSFQDDSALLYLSTDGGVDGMEVTNRLLAQLQDILSWRGVAYVLFCAQNKPNEVISRTRSDFGNLWSVEKVNSSGMKAGWEKLCVIRIERNIA